MTGLHLRNVQTMLQDLEAAGYVRTLGKMSDHHIIRSSNIVVPRYQKEIGKKLEIPYFFPHTRYLYEEESAPKNRWNRALNLYCTRDGVTHRIRLHVLLVHIATAWITDFYRKNSNILLTAYPETLLRNYLLWRDKGEEKGVTHLRTPMPDAWLVHKNVSIRVEAQVSQLRPQRFLARSNNAPAGDVIAWVTDNQEIYDEFQNTWRREWEKANKDKEDNKRIELNWVVIMLGDSDGLVRLDLAVAYHARLADTSKYRQHYADPEFAAMQWSSGIMKAAFPQFYREWKKRGLL